ncbi:HD-GYP domain-containing protein [Fusibacter ferrireducens]|uniref:HD domain-containing protein n=1 Tax=Fusibacter ferrireducens TaxID=2785058 RepID=A0ABR9ZZ44_9FIRM|nr:HD domain-containing phosphohydrolase [Fusibacter ferrireducens]MBF4695727.1 HD domain-containing protein [Fusibacter ferrireducens]
MQYKKFENKIVIVIICSFLILLGGFWRITALNKDVVAYNRLVSITIDIQSSISDIQKDYYAFFAEPLKQDKYKSEIDAELVRVDELRDLFVEGRTRGVEPLHNQFDSEYIKLKSALRFSQNFEASHIETVNILINKAQSTNLIVKQAVVNEIRHINAIISYILWAIIAGVIIGVMSILFIIRTDVLRPIREFTEVLKKKTDSNAFEYSDIKISGLNALSELADHYNSYTRKIGVINDLNDRIYAQNGFDEVLQYVFHACKAFIPYNRIGIAIISDDGKKIIATRAKADHPILLGRNYQEYLSQSSISEVIRNNEYRILNDLSEYLENKPHSESTRLILAEGLRSSITIPLSVENKVVGVIFFSSVEKNAYNMSHIHFLSNIANALAISFEKSFVYDELILASVKGFAAIVESKDHVTGNHLERMSQYARYISEILYEDKYFIQEIDENFIDQIYKFSPLHDIGKVGIEDSILNKNGKLDTQEFEVMKVHTNIGYEILRDMSASKFFNRTAFFKIAMDITRYHHEKFDGTGYPEGLIGNNIPLAARIVALADVFDALTSERPYKRAFSYEEALNIIKDGKGTHFDPEIVNCLLHHESSFKKIYRKMKYND